MIRPLTVSPTVRRMRVFITRAPGITVVELADALKVKPATVATYAHILASWGVIERQNHGTHVCLRMRRDAA